MKYTAKGNHNRDFQLFNEQGTLLGSVEYEGWFSTKVKIHYKGEVYDVNPVGFWLTSIEVTKDDIKYAELKVNWAAQMVVHITEGRTYLFKPNFWHNKFTLYTQEEQGIIILEPDFVWSKFTFNYEIETNDNYDEGKDALLILILIYCCNHLQKRASGAAAVV